MAMTDQAGIRWAPRVRQMDIRRLYELDAQGIYDDELIDEVGWALYARCDSFIAAVDAAHGRARCAQCGQIILHHCRPDDVLHCAGCGWETTWQVYQKSFQHKQLSGAEPVLSLFRDYMARFSAAQGTREKMVLIDTLIHGFHWSLRGDTTRTTAVNLIEGRYHEVVAFLDRLTYGDKSTPGARERLQQWRDRVDRSAEEWGDRRLKKIKEMRYEEGAAVATTDRLAILQRIRQMVGDRSEEQRVRQTLFFCFADGEPISAEYWQPDGYTHGDHTLPRAYIFYPSTRFEFREDGELRHYAAGTIPYRQDGEGRVRYCLFRRRAHPIGYYTIPAGHIEMGEDPKEAAIRETREETSLSVISAQLLHEGEIRDECRRGADYHYWYLYLCECAGEPALSNESDVVGWYTRQEILHDLILTHPTGLFMEQVLGSKPDHVRPT